MHPDECPAEMVWIVVRWLLSKRTGRLKRRAQKAQDASSDYIKFTSQSDSAPYLHHLVVCLTCVQIMREQSSVRLDPLPLVLSPLRIFPRYRRHFSSADDSTTFLAHFRTSSMISKRMAMIDLIIIWGSCAEELAFIWTSEIFVAANARCHVTLKAGRNALAVSIDSQYFRHYPLAS